MNHQYYPQKTERHLRLWIYLLPVVGVIPSLWALYRPRQHHEAMEISENREQQRVSRLSLTLTLVWLCSYSLLSLSAVNMSEIMSFRLLYANAILTTAYFVTCTWLMSRLGKPKSTLD